MRILLTGGTGFIGRHVLPKLGGHTVLLLTRSKARAPGGVQVLEGDLADLAGLQGPIKEFAPECCVHLAWEGRPDYSQEQCNKNRMLSTQLFNLLVDETKCARIVAAGTRSEYAALRGALKEDDPVDSPGDLALAKKQLFNCGMALANTCDIQFYWLRLFSVYGPGQRPDCLLPTLAMRFQEERIRRLTPTTKHHFDADVKYEVLTPANAHDFIHVDDAAAAIAAAVTANAPSGAYNVGTGCAVKVAKVCGLMEKKLAGRRDYTRTLKSRPRKNSEGAWADLTKTRTALGWEPKYDIAVGIDRCLRADRFGQTI
ncbi:MAG: NAD(P)-dependent oxidoreductase [Elusimicrobiota bacterium]